MDTIHYVNKLTGERRYVFTVIDLYSRVAFAKCFNRLLPGNAFTALKEAERYFGFKIVVVQTDNGPEFSGWFNHRANGQNIVHRHTRIHRPNDNAHIERFNRTLREECIGNHMRGDSILTGISRKINRYIDHYNNERLHLGIQCRTPREMLRR
jgi:putative transposase